MRETRNFMVKPFGRLRGLFRKLQRPVLSLCILLVLLCSFAFLGDEQQPSVQIAPTPQGSSILLLEDWEDLCVLAYSGGQTGTGMVLTLNASTGNVLSRKAFSQTETLWAALRGDNLFILENQGQTTSLTRLSLPNLEIMETRPLPVASNNLELYDCDSEGSFYFTTSNQPGVLRVYDTSETVREVDLDGHTGVTFLEITPKGTLFAACDALCFWRSFSDPQTLQSAHSAYAPFCLLGESYLLTDLFGYVSHYDETGIQQTSVRLSNLSSPLLFAMDQKDHLIYAQGNLVKHVSLSGETLKETTLRGTPLAVCGSGAVTLEDESYWFTPLPFDQEPIAPTPSVIPSLEPTPTPVPDSSPKVSPSPSPQASQSPSPEPSPSFSPTPSPALEQITPEGDLLVLEPDVNINQLLAYFAPDAVQIFWPNGEEVISGHLATGMTVDHYTLVVLGDCDGSGTLSQQDVRKGQALLLEGDTVNDPYRRAADLDEDGVLTTVDLVRLSQELEP